MAALLLRLAGPMQSWGTQSRFSHRDTDLEPSKSGVVGLLCAAMGKPRDDLKTIEKLAELKMGVRVDRQGTLKRDYHTAQNVIKASGQMPKEGEAVISSRFYLSDACFLVALLGELSLLLEIQESLANPVWQLYLGRKSFVPGLPVFLKDGLLSDCDNLKSALLGYPYLLRDTPEKLRLEIETNFGKGSRVKQDWPVSFISASRRFALRYVEAGEVSLKDLPPAKEESCIYLA
ncbi:MAG: type I-E CRISPR-associated protein Cas5/CasD [Chloroflexi bacterium RBG_13_53_26]|nr:MAG: type I-E CRISPR-associated protein Cas5/CasD [Chloroflexi bacterium RBG_13_53_26]